MTETTEAETAVWVWVVGRWPAADNWEFQGVFTTHEAAIAACRDESYFVGPALLNEPVSHETVLWPNVVYPLAAAADETPNV